MGGWRGLGAEPPAVGGHWGSGGLFLLKNCKNRPALEASPPDLLSSGGWMIFANKITHFYAYFGQNSYLKQ